MTKDEKKKIKAVVDIAEYWMGICKCGFKDGKMRWCESYGCTSIDELIKPLRELLDDTN